MRILVRHPVAVPPASERPNGRIQRQCEHSCNHTVRVCFRHTGIDQHTHGVCTALGDTSASKLGVGSSVRVDSITDSVWTECCHSSYPPEGGMQRRGYSANFWISTQSLFSKAVDNRTEGVPDKTMELLICSFVSDNELSIVISTAASLQEFTI